MNPINTPPTPGGSSASTPLTQTARDAASQIGQAAREKASQAADSAAQLAAEKKAAAAERVQAYGSAIHESARSLEQQDPNIAWLTHQAADRIDRVASYVRDRDFAALKEDAASLARRHPAAFFGGMCVAGLILGSVIKASARSVADRDETTSDDELGSEDRPSYASYAEESTASAQI